MALSLRMSPNWTARENARAERMLMVRRAGNHWRLARGKDHNAQWFADYDALYAKGTRIPRSLRKFFQGRSRV